MGDVAMTVPVIKAALAQNPELKITFVSRPEFADFFNEIPRLTYFPVDLNYEYKGFSGIIKLFKTLKKNASYDALADLHDIIVQHDADIAVEIPVDAQGHDTLATAQDTGRNSPLVPRNSGDVRRSGCVLKSNA